MPYTVSRPAAEKRRGHHDGDSEVHLPEAAVMLAYAMHLIEEGARSVALHPDGMHCKHFDMARWLSAAGFVRDSTGEDGCTGRYRRADVSVTIDHRSGVGDVVALIGEVCVIAECKGGIVNTRHAGQQSRLRKGLCESVGQLISRAVREGERHVAVVPDTSVTRAVSSRMLIRAAHVGIELALVARDGRVTYVQERSPGGGSE